MAKNTKAIEAINGLQKLIENRQVAAEKTMNDPKTDKEERFAEARVGNTASNDIKTLDRIKKKFDDETYV